MKDAHSDAEIRKILRMSKIALVGMSRDPSKAAHYVPRYLLEQGYDIIPVNPNADRILERRCYHSISDVADVDIVDVFRPSAQTPDVVRDAVKKSPTAIWLQLGIYNKDAISLAEHSGICTIFNRCMMVEHKRLMG